MEVAYANSARLVLAMPNATCDERVGRLFRLHASAGLPEGLSAMRLACRKPDAPLRPLPEKAPPWSALVAVDDYVLPLSRLVHQFKFSSQTALAQPWHACCYWRYYRREERAGCRRSTRL